MADAFYVVLRRTAVAASAIPFGQPLTLESYWLVVDPSSFVVDPVETFQ